ncbi:hypothetical protein OPQ81_002502 [Rhizoctonia solani]|nr:hypothetical protein OPQ81_002502 [Rhizoctonia solani]
MTHQLETPNLSTTHNAICGWMTTLKLCPWTTRQRILDSRYYIMTPFETNINTGVQPNGAKQVQESLSAHAVHRLPEWVVIDNAVVVNSMHNPFLPGTARES